MNSTWFAEEYSKQKNPNLWVQLSIFLLFLSSWFSLPYANVYELYLYRMNEVRWRNWIECIWQNGVAELAVICAVVAVEPELQRQCDQNNNQIKELRKTQAQLTHFSLRCDSSLFLSIPSFFSSSQPISSIIRYIGPKERTRSQTKKAIKSSVASNNSLLLLIIIGMVSFNDSHRSSTTPERRKKSAKR